MDIENFQEVKKFTNLPDELLVLIIEFCEIKDFYVLKLTCKRFKILLEENYTLGLLFKQILNNYKITNLSNVGLKMIALSRKRYIQKNTKNKFLKYIKTKIVEKWMNFIITKKITRFTITLLIFEKFFMIFSLIIAYIVTIGFFAVFGFSYFFKFWFVMNCIPESVHHVMDYEYYYLIKRDVIKNQTTTFFEIETCKAWFNNFVFADYIKELVIYYCFGWILKTPNYMDIKKPQFIYY